MDELKLVQPSKELEKEILEYKQEYLNCGESRINGSCGLTFFDSFDDWLAETTSIVTDKLSRDQVHASTFFAVRQRDQRIVGSIQLRHSLTEALEKYGGHIGYAIRPSERKKGYGKQQLSLVLETARSIGLPKVMLVCEKDNLASSRTILACGGILTAETERYGRLQQIYWIDLTK